MKILSCILLLLIQHEVWSVKLLDAPIPEPEPVHKAKKPTRKLPYTSSSSRSSSSSASFAGMEGMARLEGLDVKCGRTGMSVELVFSAPFPGVIYSKGHFSEPACVYVKGDSAPSKTYRFTVPIDRCGTEGQLDEARIDDEAYVENTIIVQTDPVIQEVWDEARSIKCTWSSTLQKSVNFKPIKVYEPRKVDVQLDARAINTLMEIEKREISDRASSTSSSSSPTGYVHVGEDVSVVMYVQDPKVDANVLTCNASTPGGQQVTLTDSRGCLLRPDLMTPFAKTRQTNGVQAGLMLYSYLKAFNIGESPEFLISCELEICEDQCGETCFGGPVKSRRRRSKEEKEVEILEEELEEVLSASPVSSSSSSPSTRVTLERGVIVVGKKKQEKKEEEEERVPTKPGQPKLTSTKEQRGRGCLLDNSVALLALGLLMTLVSSLGVLSAALGHRLWALKAEMNRKYML